MSRSQNRNPLPVPRGRILTFPDPLPEGLEGFADALQHPGPGLWERLCREVRAYQGVLAGFPTLAALQRATEAKTGLSLESIALAGDPRPAFRVLTPTGLALAYLVATDPGPDAVNVGWQWSRDSRGELADRLWQWSVRPVGETDHAA